MYPITHYPLERRWRWQRLRCATCGVKECPDMLRDVRRLAAFYEETRRQIDFDAGQHVARHRR